MSKHEHTTRWLTATLAVVLLAAGLLLLPPMSSPAQAAPTLNLTVTKATDTSIALKWSMNLTGVVLKGYSISWGVVGGPDSVPKPVNKVTMSNLSGLTPRTEYWFQITATLYPGSVTSNKVTVSTTGLIVAAVSHSNVSLQWVENASGEFGIERAPASTGLFARINKVGAGVTSYSDASVSASTAYRYQVSYYPTGTAVAVYTNTVTVTTLAAPPPVTIPAAPTELTATVAESNVNLRWVDNSSNETLFRIKRTLASTGSFVQIDTDGASSAGYATYSDATVLASTAYLYQVLASNLAGSSAYSNIVTVTTPAAPPAPPTKPAAPTNLAVTANAYNKVDLQWADNSSDETLFKIERAPVSTGVFAQINTTVAGTATCSDATVSASTSYVYRVRAYNTAGDSDYSNTLPVTTPAAPATKPVAPTGLTLKANAYNKVDLQWTDNSSDETLFKIERAPASTGVFVQINTTAAGTATCSDATVSASTSYVYRVRAYNTAGDSDYSNTLPVTTPAAPPTKPAAPTNLAVTANAYNKVDLQWVDNSPDETIFKIERAPASTGVFVQINTTAAGTATCSDATVSASTAYLYRVRAYNSAGDSGYSNTLPVTTPAAPAAPPVKPSAPTGLTPIVVSDSQIDLTWQDKSSDETGFILERSTTEGSGYVEVPTQNVKATTRNDTNLTEGTTYYYRVCAFNDAGSSDYAYAPADGAETKLKKPTGLAATAVSATQIDLTWTDNSLKEKNYVVERSTGADGPWTILTQPALPPKEGTGTYSYPDKTCQAATTIYYYRAYAIGSISDPSDPAKSPLYQPSINPQWIGKTPVVGEGYRVAMAGKYAYVTSSTGLQVVDVSDPTAPTVTGSVSEFRSPYDVATDGNGYVYVGDGNVLTVVDARDPSNPAVVETFALSDYIMGLCASGGKVYVADYLAGLIVVDAQNPLALTKLGGLDTKGQAMAVSVDGTLAVVADGTEGLVSVDVTNPAAPASKGTFATADYPSDVELRNGIAYVVARAAGILTVDCSNPTNMTLIGQSPTAGAACGISLSESGVYAYVANSGYGATTNGLQVFDVSVPAKPLGLSANGVTGLVRGGVCVRNGIACLAAGWNVLTVFDVRSPATPVIAMQLAKVTGSIGVAVLGGNLFALSQSSMLTYDISQPSRPLLVSALPFAAPADIVMDERGYAYIADGWSVRVIDVSDPSHPRSLPSADTPSWALGLAISGNRLYVADYMGGLLIFDCSNPASLVKLSEVSVPGQAFAVSVADNLAAVAAGSGGVQIVDLTPGSQPAVIGSYATGANVFDLACTPDYLYVAVNGSGLHVVSVANPRLPQLAGRTAIRGAAQGICVSGKYAFIASSAASTSANGLEVIDISTKASPSEFRFLPAGGNCRAVTVSGDHAFLTDDRYLVDIAQF